MTRDEELDAIAKQLLTIERGEGGYLDAQRILAALPEQRAGVQAALDAMTRKMEELALVEKEMADRLRALGPQVEAARVLRAELLTRRESLGAA